MRKSYSLFITLFLFTTIAHAQVDYPTQIQPIFKNSCNSCHSAGQNSFNSSSYDGVMASTSPSNRYDSKHVIPGDANASPLVDKIEPDPEFGSRMPQGGSLTSEQITLIRTWINEGANAEATNNEEEFTSPDEFRLLGNYPNPFNPSTQIQFEVPVASQYTIAIYTVHGQLISEHTGNATAGLESVNVDLANNPTGVYIYRVTAAVNNRRFLIGSGRMTLIK